MLTSSPLKFEDILWEAISSHSLYLLQVVFNVGRKSYSHDICRRIFALRSYLPAYAMAAFLTLLDVSLKPAGAKARLKALVWPPAQLKALLTLRFSELDFLNDAYYLIIATEAAAQQTRA